MSMWLNYFCFQSQCRNNDVIMLSFCIADIIHVLLTLFLLLTRQTTKTKNSYYSYYLCAWSAPAPTFLQKCMDFFNCEVICIDNQSVNQRIQSPYKYISIISIYNLNKLLPSDILYSNMQVMSWTQSFPNVKN